jgi:triosephosphate isomerase
MRKKYIIANWKMQGTLHMIQEWVPEIKKAAETSKANLVLCPPSIYIPYIADLANKSKLTWGAQDVSNKELGAYTGQLSATMLKEFGCKYVIVGHSERRQHNHETDHMIAEKFEAAQAEGLIPILCVGETAEEHKEHKAKQVITHQLSVVLKHVGIEAFGAAIIAYEPVWAIGTGQTATPKQAQAVHEMIRAQLADADIDVASHVPIIYGGSVKPENAKELFAQSDIDGGLVGGASLEAEDFIKIIECIK